MGNRRFTRKTTITMLATLGVLSALGVAYAAIPSSDGVIHACYNASSSPTGQLRVIDAEAGAKCAKNEKALNWNQQGPRGATGPQGPTGATGPQGPQGGVTDSYAVISSQRVPDDATSHTVASKSLPPGSYSLFASGSAQSEGAPDTIFNACAITVGGNVVTGSRMTVDANNGWGTPFAMVGQASLPDGGDVLLRCQTQNYPVQIFAASLLALKVGAIH